MSTFDSEGRCREPVAGAWKTRGGLVPDLSRCHRARVASKVVLGVALAGGHGTSRVRLLKMRCEQQA